MDRQTLLPFASPQAALALWRRLGRADDSEDDLLARAADRLGLEPVTVDAATPVDVELLNRLPAHFAKTHLLLPLAALPDGRVRVAVATPFLGTVAGELSHQLGTPVSLCLANAVKIDEVLEAAYGEGGMARAVKDLEDADFEELENIEDLKDMAQAAPVIKLVNNLFMEAIVQKASDIHLSPYEDGLEMRYRVDGILHVVKQVPRKFQAAIISRLKIIANLDIAERRIPQDGRIRLKVEGHDYDIRVAVTPTVFGEGAVMRILDKASIQVALADSGFAPTMLAQWLELIKRPNGVILVTGPTGSGKTTTLYSSLNHIKSPEIKFITVEDPVEYQLRGVDQIQVNAKVGMTFASALRSILRQDPDVLMIGEIRDFETAEIAVQSALTGHLVFSTLHTSDAATAITRLIEMGMEPYLVASTLVASLAQRLVRKLCQACRRRAPDGTWSAPGCELCGGSGYKGRLGIFELLRMTDPMRRLVLEKSDASVLGELARQEGLRSLYEDGMAKAAQGLTTAEEVARVASA
ncbi:type II secretion system protein E [Solidesulfovibrio carbinoliphilus subsp. oakridgensis]|uniref:Type II secretion system protein E n=1 Tax=Solidesulfovibrio carbinoliphilus subsp. oakridgensis TaxID=694327 RepID=G7Q643_9BACT|nr:ATPase, T2SS/T4P/T4SS family [Solidesulfovibrio carbinoliphilus]EHJ47059.1 type II secretion system protein E [Solidesulfovibrio carbinoliphilus subsp. oakridgensis]